MESLKTDYLDDILAESMGGKRKFRITRSDGSTEEVILEDMSEYDQKGSSFGAGDINKTNQAVNECFQSVSDGKALIASAITGKKVPTDATATFEEMASNISKIVLGSGNAVPADVKKGKTFTNDDGVQYTGTYDFAKETAATAAAALITEGYTAWVNGVKVTGTRPAPTTQQTGNFTRDVSKNATVTGTIVFPTSFDTTPKVALSVDSDHYWSASVTGITRSSFTYSITSYNATAETAKLQWTAYT